MDTFRRPKQNKIFFVLRASICGLILMKVWGHKLTKVMTIRCKTVLMFTIPPPYFYNVYWVFPCFSLSHL